MSADTDNIPTLDQIARKSGFSKSTVSLALRHHPRIPEATRQTIAAVAKQLNYRPDPALARVAANRWRRVPTRSTLALITTNHPSGDFLDDETLEGARSRAEPLGYHIEHFRYEAYRSPRRLAEVIYSRGIRGVLVGKVCVEGFCEAFPWHLFASVACDTGFVRTTLRMVMPDRAHAVHRAWAEATRAGYRRIGLVLFDEINAVDYFDKVSAFLFNQQQVPAQDRLSIFHLDRKADGLFQAWLERERPDVVLGFNGYIHHKLEKLGYSIPQDLGFVALMAGDTPGRNLTRFEENLGMVGQIALEQLDALLRANQFGLPESCTTLLIESRWVPGSTLPGPTPTLRSCPAAAV